MSIEHSILTDVQTSLIFQSHCFLLQIEAGVADELLLSALFSIRMMEVEVMKKHHVALNPYVWSIMLSRYMHRMHRSREMIDTLN